MRALDEKIDIHALGGVLYRLMAGPGWTDSRLPAPVDADDAADDDAAATAAAVAADDDAASDGTPSWARCGPGQSPGLSRACRLASGLVRRCWAHEPADRPAAREVVEQLQAVLSAIRNGGGGDGDPYHGDVGGAGPCLSEECGEVACPDASSSSSSSFAPAASLVADVRACVRMGAKCTDLPKERRQRQRAELLLLRSGNGGGGGLGGGGGASSDDVRQPLAAEVRRVRSRHEGGGVGAGTRDVDLGKTSGSGSGSGSLGGVTVGGLNVVDNLDAVISRAAPDHRAGSDAAFAYDSHEGAGSISPA